MHNEVFWLIYFLRFPVNHEIGAQQCSLLLCLLGTVCIKWNWWILCFFNYKLVSSGVGKDCALLVFRILVALVVRTRCYYFVSSGAGTK